MKADELIYVTHLRENGHAMAEIGVKADIASTDLYGHLPLPDPRAAGPSRGRARFRACCLTRRAPSTPVFRFNVGALGCQVLGRAVR